MTEFKQIIGRGTRVRDDYGKLSFNILDYTGTATRMFADPDFDGDPVREDEAVINDDGEVVEEREIEETAPDPDDFPDDAGWASRSRRRAETGPRKFYVDGGEVEIVRHLVYELDADGDSSPAANSPTTPATRSARSIRMPRRCAPTGSTPNAGRDRRAAGGEGHRPRLPRRCRRKAGG